MRATTLRRLERSSGEVANAGVAAMAARLPWFTRLTAEQRSGVLLVTQTGAANFVAWLRDPDATPRLTAEAFRSAPLDLARRVTLRQTVELVRIAIAVFEERIPRSAPTRPSGPRWSTRCCASGARSRSPRRPSTRAPPRPAARGTRGSRRWWSTPSCAARRRRRCSRARRRWAGTRPPRPPSLVGEPPAEEPPEPLHAVRRAAHRAGATVLLGTHGAKLVMIAGPGAPLDELSASFGPGAVVAGPDGRRAHRGPPQRRRARWPGTARSGRGRAPRAPWPPTTCSPSGCSTATPGPSSSCVARSRRRCGRPAASSRPPSSATSTSPACSRPRPGALYVHPNTVRYRLRRVAEVTGRHPGEARGALVLRLALVLDRLHSGASPG